MFCIEDKVLLSAWGGNGGVDDVVGNLRKKLDERSIESDIIYHDHTTEGADTEGLTTAGGPIRIVKPSGEQWYETFKDFIYNTNMKDYGIINLHTCNFNTKELCTFKVNAPVAPIIYHTHGIISHVAFVEYIERKDTDSINYENWLNTLSPKDRQEAIISDFSKLDVCKLQDNTFKAANKLVFLTNFTRDKFHYYHPEAAKGDENEFIIPNGSDIGKYANKTIVEQRAKGIHDWIKGDKNIRDTDLNVIMFSGRITPPKGSTDLAKAFDKYKARYGNRYGKTKLLLVGEFQDGGEHAFYENIRPEFRKDVYKTPWIYDKEELAGFYMAADVMTLPSYHETFSISALESMFMGTPVIIGDVDGSHEVYVKPQLAYGAKPGNIDRMVDLFKYLFEDRERAKTNASFVQKVVNGRKPNALGNTVDYTLNGVVDTTLGLYYSEIMQNGSKIISDYLKKGDKKSAKEAYQKILKNLPFNPEDRGIHFV